jgi:hypothetical protein
MSASCRRASTPGGADRTATSHRVSPGWSTTWLPPRAPVSSRSPRRRRRPSRAAARRRGPRTRGDVHAFQGPRPAAVRDQGQRTNVRPTCEPLLLHTLIGHALVLNIPGRAPGRTAARRRPRAPHRVARSGLLRLQRSDGGRPGGPGRSCWRPSLLLSCGRPGAVPVPRSRVKRTGVRSGAQHTGRPNRCSFERVFASARPSAMLPNACSTRTRPRSAPPAPITRDGTQPRAPDPGARTGRPTLGEP